MSQSADEDYEKEEELDRDEEFQLEDDDEEFQPEEDKKKKKKRRHSVSEDESEEEEVRVEVSEVKKPKQPVKKKVRGRKPLASDRGPVYDENGNQLVLVHDEYVLPEDEEGETKITKDGVLLGGRQFKVRSFTVRGRGNTHYMLSTEPARCVGFRDSYLLFQKHPYLYKLIISDEEKFDLINRELIPPTYRARTIGLVTARSIFREFGAKIVIGGRNIVDDYQVKKIREEGKVVEGELAEPQEFFNLNAAYTGSIATPPLKNETLGGSSSNFQFTGTMVPTTNDMVDLKNLRNSKSAVNLENWMFKHAVSAREFEIKLLQDRLAIERGLRDGYTGLQFVPSSTQPTKTVVRKIGNDSKKLIVDTVVDTKNLFNKFTGLKNVDIELFKDVLPTEIQDAIIAQQKLENQVI